MNLGWNLQRQKPLAILNIIYFLDHNSFDKLSLRSSQTKLDQKVIHQNRSFISIANAVFLLVFLLLRFLITVCRQDEYILKPFYCQTLLANKFIDCRHKKAQAYFHRDTYQFLLLTYNMFSLNNDKFRFRTIWYYLESCFHIILGLINYRDIAFIQINLENLKKSPNSGLFYHKNDFYLVDCKNEIQEVDTIIFFTVS